ncbi:MAG: ATP-binding protein [Alphaproteobacteria bacterium]|nr:ATP-binding protein [Alphaproteobacteria bacterium]
MRPLPLKQQLFRSLARPIIASLFAIGAVSFAIGYYEIGQTHDTQLENVADVLWILTQKEINEQPVEHSDLSIFTEENKKDLAKYKDWLAFRIWKDGKLLTRSLNARPANIPPADKEFSDFYYNDHSWRAFALYIPEHKVIVEVAGEYEERQELSVLILLGLMVPLFLAFPVVILLIRKGINSGLQSLDQMTGQVQERSPLYLTKLPTEGVPPDLFPLAEAINNLMTKLEASLEHERRFTDNAAHELRTPLAIIKAQAQVAAQSEKSKERQKALTHLLSGVDGMTRLVEQLLIVARLSSQQADIGLISLTETVRQTAAELAPFALQKDITLSLEGDDSICIKAQHDMLGMLVRNLIDNAIKYTPSGGMVMLRVTTLSDKVVLEVTDNGRGIPTDERDKVFERFYRLPGSNAGGSGLGLSIVKMITKLFQADIVLESPEGHAGTCIKVIFNRLIQ